MAHQPSSGKGFSLVGFLGEVKAELNQVTWPTKHRAINLTVLVIGASVGVGAALGGLDYLFVRLMGLIIK